MSCYQARLENVFLQCHDGAIECQAPSRGGLAADAFSVPSKKQVDAILLPVDCNIRLPKHDVACRTWSLMATAVCL
jgi:hypothetical protein